MNRGWRLLVALGAVAASSAPAGAKATWVKKAQAVDPTIQDCLACHLTKKGRDLNSGRGQFLEGRKKELNATEIDFNWLKDYKEPESPPEPTPTPTPSETK